MTAKPSEGQPMTVSTNSSVPVLIAGGGPVGLALAADLGRRGIRTTLIERRPNKLGAPRMLEVGVRTMEFCRSLGIVEQVRNWGFPRDHHLDSVFVTNLDGYELGRVKNPSLATHRASDWSPERGQPCPQTWFDPILQKCARSYSSVTLRHQWQLDDFTQDDAGVTSKVTDLTTGNTACIRSSYLVGCDGFESTVRQNVGFSVRGQSHLDWSLNIYLRIPDFPSLHHTGAAFRYVFVGPEGVWSFLTMIDGKDLYRLQLPRVDQDAARKIDVSAVMRRCFGRDVYFTVEEKSLWVRRMTVADRFMDDRVFLAGDAAHAHPPNGGLGMNTGIQDAFDLGWKLAAVINGWGGPSLLESYDYERRPASSRATEVSLLNYHRLSDGSKDPDIEEATHAGDAARRAVGERLVNANEKAWNPPGVHLGYIYSPSPIVIPDGTTKPEDDTFRYVPTAFPGARAPHIWLSTERSIIDLFGQGFVLLAFADCDATPLEDAARLRGVPLKVHRILSRKASELYARNLVLVRPDGHVAWRSDALPRDCMALIDTVRGAGSRAAARRAADQLDSLGQSLDLAPQTDQVHGPLHRWRVA